VKREFSRKAAFPAAGEWKMSLNVLITDDSSVMRAMILKALKMAGLPLGEVYQASNGQEGLDILGRHWIDLILVDINMPVMTGEEMIERIRRDDELASLPIVVVSTEGSETRIERLKQMNAEFVHKPFSPEEIRDVVEKITGIQV